MKTKNEKNERKLTSADMVGMPKDEVLALLEEYLLGMDVFEALAISVESSCDARPELCF